VSRSEAELAGVMGQGSPEISIQRQWGIWEAQRWWIRAGVSRSEAELAGVMGQNGFPRDIHTEAVGHLGGSGKVDSRQSEPE
jgi:hypothetical protein